MQKGNPSTQKQKWSLYLLMLLKLPNNAWKVQRGLLKERSLKETPNSFILLDVLVSLPDTHRTLGQSRPCGAIPPPLYIVRQFSAVRTQVCAGPLRNTELVCLVTAWGQSKDRMLASLRSGPVHLHVYTCSSLCFMHKTRCRRSDLPYVCLAECGLKSCYPPTCAFTIRG